jgi:hypothetical protein
MEVKKMSDEINSASVVAALDRISFVLEHHVPDDVIIEQPQLTIGPVEHVLAFKINEHHFLKDANTQTPHFSNQGYFSDLYGRVLRGSSCRTGLKIDISNLPETEQWPLQQPEPFDDGISIPDHTHALGYSKQAYFFPDGSSLVTTGPSVPKIVKLKDGGAQLWVASVGVIAQGTGKYEGVRGLSSYVGSAHFPNWPATPPEQLQVLAAGFPAVIAAYFKLILKEDRV